MKSEDLLRLALSSKVKSLAAIPDIGFSALSVTATSTLISPSSAS
jgi:hypothetical protein